MAKYWYTYNSPTPCTASSRILVSNWNYAGFSYNPLWCPLSFATCCAIYATGAAGVPSFGTHPSAIPATNPGQISVNLQTYLFNTIGAFKRFPTTSGGKSFLYNKT